jgi:hypothetical protein
VYFIFQPAEESEGGAAVMIEDGLFEVSDDGGVWPAQLAGHSRSAQMAVMPGPVMAGTCAFEITVRGHGCHAAMPHQGVDTLVVASQLVQALQTVVARNVHPCESAVVSVTQIHGGEAWNIIPDEAVLRGTIRSFKPERSRRRSSAPSSACAAASRAAFAAQISVHFDHRYPPTVNSVGGKRSSVAGGSTRLLRCRQGAHQTSCRRWARRISPTCCARSRGATSGWATARAPAAAPAQPALRLQRRATGCGLPNASSGSRRQAMTTERPWIRQPMALP